MTAQEIVTKVISLHFPEGSYVVFGSCPLAVAGLREANDIDMLVTPELFNQLAKNGWKEFVKAPNDKPLIKGDFEVHVAWDFSTYQPTLKQLLASAQIIDGVPFAALEEVRKWKLSSGRAKDLEDIQLIEDYYNDQKTH